MFTGKMGWDDQIWGLEIGSGARLGLDEERN